LIGWNDSGWTDPDCNDSDAIKQQLVYGDTDLDGVRAARGAATACVAYTTQLPAGYSTLPGNDCNDHDPLVFPEQADLVGDGIDANCDGSDGSAGIACADVCGCWPRVICDGTTTCSDRADLAVVDVIAGVLCGGPKAGLIAVVNRGAALFRGTVTVTDSDFYGGSAREPYCWYDTPLELELLPGQGRSIEVDPLCQRPALVITSGDDCLPENNATRFRTEVSCGS
jgi:hypothetical protein